EVKVWQEYYNSTTRKTDYKQLNKIYTGNDGAFKIDSKTESNLRIELTTPGDHLFLDNNVNSYVYGRDGAKDSVREETFLFTDRPLYRPGQVVFFKGIAVKKNR